MNSNSVAKEIERQTGLKRSTKEKKYAQECGRGNICYAYRFAGYRYHGDFHIVKEYSDVFEISIDSNEGKSKLNDILNVIKGLGLEIVAEGINHIEFKIPFDENKWYGSDGMYRKGKWSLRKSYRKDDEYNLYKDDEPDFVKTITAYSPSSAKYSADYFIENYGKENVMSSKSNTNKTIRLIKSSQAYVHQDNMETIRERLENTIEQSSVDTMYDGEDCFITVTQRNETTGNESKWSFCVDFGTNKVQMLEPTEDEEGFTSDNEVFRIIKNFLNGGMSREKRMNRPDYDSGGPIKITGFGNKIGSARKSIKSEYNDIEGTAADREAFAKALQLEMDRYGLKFKEGTLEDNMIDIYDNYITIYYDNLEDEDAMFAASDYIRDTCGGVYELGIDPEYFDGGDIFVLGDEYWKLGEDDDLLERQYLAHKPIKSSYEYARQYGWDFVDWIAHGDMNFNFDSLSNERIDEMYDEFLDIKNQPLYDINSSRKPIKSAYFNPEEVFAYLVGGPADMITSDDKAQADNYNVVYYGYGIMDDGEKGHLFIGKYKDIKSYIEDYMGAAVADDYIYSYKINGAPVTESFQYLATNPLPTEKDYQDVVNKLNEYVDKEYGREFGTGSIYHFNMYKGQGMNNDGYGNEYPNYVIFDTEGNLNMHSDDDIVEYIRKILDEKGWYAEPVSAADNFTIAIK